MEEDRSWMNHRGMVDRRKPKYMAGVDGFLEFAFNGKEGAVLRCPCMKCNLILYHNRDTMWEHLMAYGILPDYNPWVDHGEKVGKSDILDKYKENALDVETDSGSDDEIEMDIIMDTSDESVDSDSNVTVNCEDSAQNTGNLAAENHGTSENASGVALTYRQRRRLQSAKKKGRKKRDPSRALKVSCQRLKNSGIKLSADMPDSLTRVVGPNAGQFIAECSNWVKLYCPLNSRNWTRMDATAKQALFDKIKEEWNLPAGPQVERAVKKQCARLYRFWRYRLKERHFVGKSQNEALNDRPPEVDETTWRWLVVDYWGDEKIKEISSKNRKNSSLQKKKSVNGALSTARVLENRRSAPSASTSNEEPYKDGQGSNPGSGKSDQIMGNNDQIIEEEVNVCALKVHPKKMRSEDGSSELSLALQSQLIERISRLEEKSAKREAALNEKLERMQAEALQREQLLRDEIEKLKAEAEEMRGEKEITPEREDKVLDEVMGMKGQLGQLLRFFQSSSQATP